MSQRARFWRGAAVRASVHVMSALDLNTCLCRLAPVLPSVRSSAANIHRPSCTLCVETRESELDTR